MGVIASVVLYRTDGNQIVAVNEMETSHLLNAIHHHNKQVDTCKFLIDTIELNGAGRARITDRMDKLCETVIVLGCELVSRDPKDDEERFPKDQSEAREFY